MGYTTEFSGAFDLDKPADAETTLFMRDVSDMGIEAIRQLGGAPDTYCQWEITKDRLHIKWDGGENFYDYVEWLQWLIDNKLKPAGLTLSGSVKFHGEEVEDCGTIAIVDGRVVKTMATFETAHVRCPSCDEVVDAIVVPR